MIQKIFSGFWSTVCVSCWNVMNSLSKEEGKDFLKHSCFTWIRMKIVETREQSAPCFSLETIIKQYLDSKEFPTILISSKFTLTPEAILLKKGGLMWTSFPLRLWSRWFQILKQNLASFSNGLFFFTLARKMSLKFEGISKNNMLALKKNLRFHKMSHPSLLTSLGQHQKRIPNIFRLCHSSLKMIKPLKNYWSPADCLLISVL